jgi:CheY-like chemotaxis protein
MAVEKRGPPHACVRVRLAAVPTHEQFGGMLKSTQIYFVGLDDLAGRRVREALPVGMQVTELDTGDAALARIRTAGAAAVVVDFPIPLRDGGTLTEALKSDPALAGIPVIAYSGWGFARTRATARRLGCYGFLTPHDSDQDLRHVLERALSGAAAHQVDAPRARLAAAG